MQTYPVVLQFCNFNVLKPIQKQTSSTNFWLSIVSNPRLPLFPLLRTVIGLEKSRHPFNQSDAKRKPIANKSHIFLPFGVILYVFIFFL